MLNVISFYDLKIETSFYSRLLKPSIVCHIVQYTIKTNGIKLSIHQSNKLKNTNWFVFVSNNNRLNRSVGKADEINSKAVILYDRDTVQYKAL